MENNYNINIEKLQNVIESLFWNNYFSIFHLNVVIYNCKFCHMSYESSFINEKIVNCYYCKKLINIYCNECKKNYSLELINYYDTKMTNFNYYHLKLFYNDVYSIFQKKYDLLIQFKESYKPIE